jgi:hypothetical protein
MLDPIFLSGNISLAWRPKSSYIPDQEYFCWTTGSAAPYIPDREEKWHLKTWEPLFALFVDGRACARINWPLPPTWASDSSSSSRRESQRRSWAKH